MGLTICMKVGYARVNTTAQGRLSSNMFVSLAEFEHDLIRERTQVGLSAARAKRLKWYGLSRIPLFHLSISVQTFVSQIFSFLKKTLQFLI